MSGTVVSVPEAFGTDLTAIIATASVTGDDIGVALELACALGPCLAQPASGSTASRWSVLTAVARVNLTVARVLEAHADALAILDEAGELTDDRLGRTWGVFAAEAPGTRLEATGPDGAITVTGVKPWCSLGSRLDAALVTAHVGDRRQLFAVDLRHPSVHADSAEGWVARGLRTVTSGPVRFEATPATPIGDVGWYLERPGFAWGGIGVAACWHGGALGIADTLQRHAQRVGGELSALHVGIVDVALHTSSTALAHAAATVDAGGFAPGEPAVLAHRTRAVVAAAAERVLHQAGHALGPAPLAFDPDHAARVADLTLYVRQHHGERDLAALGAQLLGPVA